MFIPIHAIYPATEGEGLFVGRPQVFVRLQGCAVGCLNCDSRETWDFNLGQLRSLDDVVSQVLALGRDWVSITGGDPLHPKLTPPTLALLKEFKSLDIRTNLEASGTRYVKEAFDLADWVSFDIKTPSTGVRYSLNALEQLIKGHPKKFQIKAVVQDERDFEFVTRIYEQLGSSEQHWIITPAWNTTEELPSDRVRLIEALSSGKYPFRVVLQQHKVMYGSSRTNV